MEWLFTNTQITHASYPLVFFYLIASVGILLLTIRPYWAFLLSVFCLAARNFHAAVFTRTPMFGPYMNLNDLLEWIAIFALVLEILKYRRKIWSPAVLLLLLGLVIIGDIQSIFKYGLAENVLRRIWSTAIFPVMFLIAANMVVGEKRAKKFYWALFSGAVLAALQHMFYVKFHSFSILDSYALLRTISYLFSGGIYLLIGAIYWPSEDVKGYRYYGYIAGLGFIFLSYFFSLTRTVWVSAILCVFLIPIIFRKSVFFSKSIVKILGYVLVGIIFATIIFPNINLSQTAKSRFNSFLGSEKAFSEAYRTREEGYKTELKIWLDGSIILGTGASLPLEYVGADPYQTGALGHVALSTYLAHYGILGVMIYLILVPLKSIQTSKIVYLRDLNSYCARVSLAAMACILMGVLASLSSVQYIGATSHIEGLLYGSIWGLFKGYTNNWG